MGFAGRKPILPAATDSEIGPVAEDTVISEEIATDLSQKTDRTSHTIPEDGRPIVISTKRKSSKGGPITKTSQHSQTSLLIEYFEGGKEVDSSRRPSVRVKVTPSRRVHGKSDGHVVLSETQGTRKPSYTRRISLGSGTDRVVQASDLSVSAPLRAGKIETSDPVDIEVLRKHSDLSDLSGSPRARYNPAGSDISSMPAESLLNFQQSTLGVPTRGIEPSNLSSFPGDSVVSGPGQPSNVSSMPGDSIMSTSEVVDNAAGLKPPVLPRERNLSHERITQKAIEKITNKPRDTAKISSRYDKVSSRSSRSDELPATSTERQRAFTKHLRDEDSITEPSVLSNSAISAGGKSFDQHSARSGASNVSINNPRLLQTVEDAIRRLILPELKELKKDQRHASHKKHAKDYSDLSESSVSQERTSRRVSSGSKSKRRTSKEHADASGSRRQRSHHKDFDYDSISETSSRRRESFSDISNDDPKRSQRKEKDHHKRDMAAAGLVGAGLTAAALEHKNSSESAERRRRRKRSKSRSSRSASAAESEEIFEKHHVPPMPMQSEVGSEITRSSLLSSNTAGTTTPTQHEVREVVRGSPRELLSPAPDTPTKRSDDVRQSLGMHHGNFSERDLSAQRLSTYDEHDEVQSEPISPETERYETEQYDTYQEDEPLEESELMKQYERNLHTQHPIRRGLSPIQSVASYATTEPNRNSMMHPRSVESFASSVQKDSRPRQSVDAISELSSDDMDLKKSRPHGISLENRSEIMNQHSHSPQTQERDFSGVDLHDEDHFSDAEEMYRDSFVAGDDQHMTHRRHLSGLTDESSDVQYVDKVTAGQQVTYGIGANPEYVYTPPGVESAVASLIEPSSLDIRGSQSSHNTGSFVQDPADYRSSPRQPSAAAIAATAAGFAGNTGNGSPLRRQLATRSQSSFENPRKMKMSPAQSPARSFEQEHIRDRPSSFHSPIPTTEPVLDASPQSEITTNPSPIQGPISGMASNNADRWPYDPSVSLGGPQGLSRDFSSGAVDLIPEGLNVSQRQTTESRSNHYVIGRAAATPPSVKDEGYYTGDNFPSQGAMGNQKSRALSPDDIEFHDPTDDPFTSKRNQYMGGLSQGTTPLYDVPNSVSLDRIKSEDIVALMEHLTVRDAQRDARDSQILFSLVQSAAEMRNSFEEMRTFIQQQDEQLLKNNEQQHMTTQKAIGGPRPPPASTRFQKSTTTSQEDLPTKRRNIFQRAFPSLGSKNTAELQNIEAMLMHLLDEVEILRGQQSVANTHAGTASLSQARSASIASEDHARPPTDTGYEPEGQAGTSSTGGRSGFFSNDSSRQGHYQATRRISENRVSTVMEGDEDFDDYDATQDDDGQITPRAASPVQTQQQSGNRGQSVSFNTPPTKHDSTMTGTSFQDNTPYRSMDGSVQKKHKSFASSIFPKMVSRWSKTTASSADEASRASFQTRDMPYSEASQWEANDLDYQYEADPDDRLRSNTSLQREQMRDQENRPPSPLIPSQISENPKYQGYRNSINLQHPQPRQGPTGRYQYTLESAAQDYDQMSPASQTSSQWDGRPTMAPTEATTYAQPSHYVPQAPLSPISDAGYSETSSAMLERDGYGRRAKSTGSQSSVSKRGPPRPPKVLDDGPLVPERPPKNPMSPSTYLDQVAAARAGSPALNKSPIGALRSPQSVGRKPSGPRPLSGQGKRTRFNNSPLQHDSEDDGRY